MKEEYCLKHNIDPAKLPRHVAIIMDGNGRWAKQRGLPRSNGHVEGVTTVRAITEEASDLGIGFLTLYTFSTENWNRPAQEVDALMELISIAISRETPDLIKNNVRLTMVGDFDRLPLTARQRLNESFEATASCTGLTVCLAISYSSRWEITSMVRQLVKEAVEGKLTPQDITDEMLSSRLTTAFMPDPDLLIRTGGDKRVSNYLLWQIAYSELSFTDTYWPDFTRDEFRAIIAAYQQRQRRFGLTGEQVSPRAVENERGAVADNQHVPLH